jgi:hypothetical protein
VDIGKGTIVPVRVGASVTWLSSGSYTIITPSESGGGLIRYDGDASKANPDAPVSATNPRNEYPLMAPASIEKIERFRFILVFLLTSLYNTDINTA